MEGRDERVAISRSHGHEGVFNAKVLRSTVRTRRRAAGGKLRLPAPACQDADLRIAFDFAPVGLCVAGNREIQKCNEAFAAMFGYEPSSLVGRPLIDLYPSHEEAARVTKVAGLAMGANGCYSDDRIMRHRAGHLFWCHVSGRSLDRFNPLTFVVWMFEDISERRPIISALTPRERDVAKFLIRGETSKQIARQLAISPRTVEAHSARLMKKVGAASHAEMIAHLVKGVGS